MNITRSALLALAVVVTCTQAGTAMAASKICPSIAILCKPGTHAAADANGCLTKCVANTPARICPSIAILCKKGTHAGPDANGCLTKCVPNLVQPNK